jgi:predicted MFS family arabinose efflux permease
MVRDPNPESAVEPQSVHDPQPKPSRTSLRGLDGFVFFVADVQTGFGPFIAVYLTAQAWTQLDIGVILSVGGLAALAGQIPGGAIVDAARSERMVAGIAIILIGLSALSLAIWPIYPVVLAAAVVHALASCALGPAMAAISLGLVGHAGIGERLGRNARFASIGNGMAAGAMGLAGYLVSNRSVFIVTALLVIPALFMLARIRGDEIDVARAHGGVLAAPRSGRRLADLWRLGAQRPFLVLAAGIALFHLANASMLPIMARIVTTRAGDWATVLIAACIVVPQIMVALVSPWVGRQAQLIGRRPLLILALSALVLRGALFTFVRDPVLLVAIQALDGIAAAGVGVMVPLIVADVTRGTGHFNLALGMMGTAIGLGASVSTTVSGYITDHYGSAAAFAGLAFAAALSLLWMWSMMPETRPRTGITPKS